MLPERDSFAADRGPAEQQHEDTNTELSLDLSERLIGLCADFNDKNQIDCQLLVIPAHTRLKSQVSVIVFRAIRELLTNVKKHSQANNVEVASALRDGGAVEFSVCDDGIGLLNTEAPWQSGEDGFGVWSIVQRLREVGGLLESDTQDGACFRIVLPPDSLGAI